MSTISRRAFLKTVGVGALSVAAVSVLAGCDKLPTGTTETPVTGAVEAKNGTLVNVDDKYTVLLNSTTTNNNSKANHVAGNTQWWTNYTTGYESKIDSEADYNGADDELIQDAIDAGYKAAEDTDAALLTITSVTINNYTSEAMLIASNVGAASVVADVKSNSSVFTATADGKEIECEVNTVSVAAMVGTTAGTAAVTCWIAAPANWEEIVLKVALPGASKAVEYKLVNDNYKDAKTCENYGSTLTD